MLKKSRIQSKSTDKVSSKTLIILSGILYVLCLIAILYCERYDWSPSLILSKPLVGAILFIMGLLSLIPLVRQKHLHAAGKPIDKNIIIASSALLALYFITSFYKWYFVIFGVLMCVIALVALLSSKSQIWIRLSVALNIGLVLFSTIVSIILMRPTSSNIPVIATAVNLSAKECLEWLGDHPHNMDDEGNDTVTIKASEIPRNCDPFTRILAHSVNQSPETKKVMNIVIIDDVYY